ncbi:Fanconi anemia group G protein isoform X2 [Neolamprologus brichardi]|uniref:Fanconi anemia group G protein isoform X2 n=1 Tax=Neolamprologus brichardi TaxID=32507 RepID=UPI0003EBC869|nr:Fanconi anemia group G protein isoform X2 [Neolamprologus brichardi]
MYQPTSLLEKWSQENNELVNKCKQQEAAGGAVSRDHSQSSLRWCSSEFHKLLRKIQGIPPHVDHSQLELAVVYNTCVCFTAQSQFSEAELLLKEATERVLQVTGNNADTSDPLVLWRAGLKSAGNTALHPHVLYLLCLQWALWLAKCQLENIWELQEQMSSLCELVCDGVGDGSPSEAKGRLSKSPLLVMELKRLTELLQICTSIAQGAEKLNEGRSSEALSDLQAASALSATRALVAYTHLLSGSCLAHMNRPQMALQCYKRALETDSRCVCALYRSMLIYRQLGNTQAEIQALRLLHSTLMLPPATEPVLGGIHPLSPSLLLSSHSLSRLLLVPSALSVLYSLALKCVLSGRVTEGVEHYLDLLAALHSEDQHAVDAEVSVLPRMPELYLEAGAALLFTRRPADCMALCNEVISTTLELVPEKVVLEEPDEGIGGDARGLSVEGEDKVAMLLWAAAAYLLQGHCHAHLKDWKQAVTHYTRCINLLVKVHLKNRDFQPQIPAADVNVKHGKDLCALQRMKGLSLAWRGISFTQMDQLREALRDLQLSLQAFPDYTGAGLWCGEVLWRLGRKHEAAACWEKTWSLTTQTSVEKLPLYLQDPQSGPLLDSVELRLRIQELGLT